MEGEMGQEYSAYGDEKCVQNFGRLACMLDTARKT